MAFTHLYSVSKSMAFVSVALLGAASVNATPQEDKRSEFVDVGALLPNAMLDIRYFGQPLSRIAIRGRERGLCEHGPRSRKRTDTYNGRE